MLQRITQTFLIFAVVSATSCVAGHALEPSEHHDWRDEPHHISLLVGNTVPDEESTAATIGVDYEYRVSDRTGLGGVVEYAGEDLDAITLLVVADIHLTPQFILQTGPGVEFVHSEQEAVIRLGALYEFLMDGYTVSPQLHYDWTSAEDSVVLALAIGWGF